MTTPTLLVPQLLASTGDFPVRGNGEPVAPTFTMGMIQSFGGMANPFGTLRCEGQVMPLQSNPPLYSVMGTAYGGNGVSTFAYPQLNDVSAVGGGPAWPAPAGALSTSYVIAAESRADAPLAGMVIAFTGSYAPAGWLDCNGALLSIAKYPTLFEVIGNAFGGDGETSFALPDLSVSAPLGVSSKVKMGQWVDGPVPGLGMQYLISEMGYYPQMGGDGSFPDSEPVVGQIVAWASEIVPKGWAPCQGQLMPIGNYQALYTVLGTTWGGDGTTNFALPDLRGKMIAGLP